MGEESLFFVFTHRNNEIVKRMKKQDRKEKEEETKRE
jgi:hypothetical protein